MARAKSSGWRTVRDWTIAQAVQGLLTLGRLFPYALRVRGFGWLAGRLALFTAFPRRIRANLDLVCPELSEVERRRITRRVPVNVARTLIESHYGAEFKARLAAAPIHGAEWMAEVEAAHAAGRPVILVTGHFGNYHAPQVMLGKRGVPVGGLYRPMKNRFYNARYVAMMARMSGPVFPRGRRGLAEMVRHLRAGGAVGLLIDQRMPQGVPLSFFGHPAWTALSAAEMAVKYDALILPAYGRRTGPHGLDFEVIFEAPIPHGDPAAMTQALNDSLEAQIRSGMDQWLWLHRRWRVPGRKDRPVAG